MSLVFSRKMQVSVTCAEQTRCTFFALKSLISSRVVVNIRERIIKWRGQQGLQQPVGRAGAGSPGQDAPADQGRPPLQALSKRCCPSRSVAKPLQWSRSTAGLTAQLAS